MEEKKVRDAQDAFIAEAAKNVVSAFNEGFQLGKEYAEKLYKK